jgi:hypothetical protein
MREVYNPDIVIGIDVESKIGSFFKNIPNYGDYLSGWWLLTKRLVAFLNPFSKNIDLPKFSQIIYALLYLNHSRNIRSFVNDNLIDIYIYPELGNVMLLDYGKMKDIVEIGYRYAKIALTTWKLQNKRFIPLRRLEHSRSLEELSSKSSSPLLRGLRTKSYRVPPKRSSDRKRMELALTSSGTVSADEHVD